MSILSSTFITKFNTAPFSKITNSDFVPAFHHCISEAKKEINQIVSNSDEPSFQNTLEALEFSGEQLDRISSIFFNLNAAETNDDIQQIAQEISPLLTEFNNDIILNEELFEKIKYVFKQKEQLDLSIEQKTLLEKRYKTFVRNGALLNENQKNRLREIDTKLAKLALTFGENVLAETNAYFLQITNEVDLAGLPDGVIEMAKAEAQSRNLEGWVFTLDYPSYIPFVTYSENRELRNKISVAFGSKSFKNNEYNNEKIVQDILQLRHERAELLGYQTHSHFVLEERMAKSSSNVLNFLNDILIKAKPAAKKEFKQLTDFAKELDGIDLLEKWDGAFYSEKLKQKLFNLDDEILKPYFKLENVEKGAFEIANRLFGISFIEVFDVDKYHPDVKTFKVVNQDNELVAIFYSDYFPRKGKRGGAWMTSFKSQYIKNGVNERPHVSIVCNFTKPTPTKPSLLTFNEVTTLFHEFGHALHGMLANTTYPSLSGTSVFWDFVELPSQILENWCYEPEALALFAKHYETGEVIPQKYVDKIRESASFMEGIATLRQLSFGLLDMEYHVKKQIIENVKSFEKEVMKETSLYPDVAENCMSVSFSHIFQGGYSSGYYSYKWAEVLDADAFEAFQEKGILNAEVGISFKENILSKGGTEHPMTLYKRFRGKEPKPDALLKRAGLV